MSLLRYNENSPARELRPYTVLRCAANGHQVSFCRGLCRPTDGIGQCGRLAPHAMTSRTQLAIARHLQEQAAARA